MIPERLVPGTLEWDLYYFEHKQRYDLVAGKCRGLTVLDAACGAGYGSALMADAGAKYVLGVDISKGAISYAERNYACSNVSFINTDVQKMALASSIFDMVVSLETLEHIKNPDLFLNEVRRVIKPGGLFACSITNKAFFRRYANPYHLSEMTFAEFAEAFGRHFEIEEKYHQSHSASYIRYLELLSEIRRLQQPLRYSRLLAFEDSLRRMLGRPRWEINSLPSVLTRAVAGDFVLEPLDKPSDNHLTYILVGHAKEHY